MIKDILNEKHINFEYYGKSDLSTGHEIKLLLDNSEQIKKYLKELNNYEISNKEEFINYLLIKKYSQFIEIVEYVYPEHQQLVKEIIELFIDKEAKFEKKNIVKYLKKSSIDLIKEKDYRLNKQIIIIVGENSNSFNELIVYLIKNNLFEVIHYFNYLGKIIIKSDALLDKFLNVDLKQIFESFHLNDYLYILKTINKSKKEKIVLKVDELFNYSKELMDKINEDNVVQYQQTIFQLENFFVDIKHKGANVFAENKDKLKELNNKYLKKHGQRFSYKYSLKDVKSYLNDKKIPMMSKLYSLTHNAGKHFSENIFKNKKASITDFVSSNIKSNQIYTISVIRNINLWNDVYISTMTYMFNKEKIQESFTELFAFIYDTKQRYKLRISKEEIEFDIEFLLNMYNFIYINEKLNEINKKGIYYSIICYTIGLIEKILFLVYESINKDEEIINRKYLTLGSFFVSNNNEWLIKIIGKSHFKYLKYCLLNDKGIGLDLRNKFVHIKDLDNNEIHYGTCLLSLSLFIGVINGLLSYYLFQEKQE